METKVLFSIMSLKQACLCLYISILCVQESKSCFGRSSPYRGFGVCLDVWDWKCPYEEKCIETWKVCDGWADCISRRDESNDACREKEEMACRYEKWRWKEIKSYFLNAVSRRKGDEMKKYPYLYQKQSSVSNCC